MPWKIEAAGSFSHSPPPAPWGRPMASSKVPGRSAWSKRSGRWSRFGAGDARSSYRERERWPRERWVGISTRGRYHAGEPMAPPFPKADPMSESPPDRLSNDPKSQHHDAASLEGGVGIRFKGV